MAANHAGIGALKLSRPHGQGSPFMSRPRTRAATPVARDRNMTSSREIAGDHKRRSSRLGVRRLGDLCHVDGGDEDVALARHRPGLGHHCQRRAYVRPNRGALYGAHCRRRHSDQQPAMSGHPGAGQSTLQPYKPEEWQRNSAKNGGKSNRTLWEVDTALFFVTDCDAGA